MNRFPMDWCRCNNLLIVVSLLCYCLPSVTFGDLGDFDCPVSTEDSDIEASCTCEGVVRCNIGSSLPINSTFWVNFGQLNKYNAIDLSLFQAESSNVTYFPVNLFPNLSPSINEIILSSWKFSSIPLFKVPRTINVTSLTITDNEPFTSIGPRAFAPLSLHLERLSLTSNGFEAIDQLAFKGLKNLREVKLVANHLTSLPDNLFIDSIKLNNLSLSNNAITLVHQATFRGLSALRDLELNRNQLFTIMDNTFLELTNLRSLDLSHNKINSLGPLAFNGLTFVEYIDLSSNLLQNLPLELLTRTPRLMEIDLKHNRLNLLDDNFLKQLPKIVFLKDNAWNCNCNLIVYEKKLLVDNSDTKCTTSNGEFNKSNKPVKLIEMTFKEYIEDARNSPKSEACYQINNKEKRSHITMASSSPLGGQKSSSFSLSSFNFIMMMVVTLRTFMILKVIQL